MRPLFTACCSPRRGWATPNGYSVALFWPVELPLRGPPVSLRFPISIRILINYSPPRAALGRTRRGGDGHPGVWRSTRCGSCFGTCPSGHPRGRCLAPARLGVVVKDPSGGDPPRIAHKSKAAASLYFYIYIKIASASLEEAHRTSRLTPSEPAPRLPSAGSASTVPRSRGRRPKRAHVAPRARDVALSKGRSGKEAGLS